MRVLELKWGLCVGWLLVFGWTAFAAPTEAVPPERAKIQLEKEVAQAKKTVKAYRELVERLEKAKLLETGIAYFQERVGAGLKPAPTGTRKPARTETSKSAPTESDALLHYALGESLRRVAKPMDAARLGEAADHLEIALKTFPKEREVRLNLARVQLALHDGDGALETLARLQEMEVEETAVSGDQEALSLAAQAYAVLRDYPHAEEVFQEALAMDPRNVEDRMKYANILRVTGKYDAAAEQLGMALRYRNRSPEIYYELGKVYAHMNRPEDAVEQYKRARRYDPDNVEARYELADIFLENDNGRYAILSIRSALALDKRYEAYLEPLKSATTLEAADALSKALAKVPDNAPLQEFVGNLYLKIGDRANAKTHFEQAKRLDPNNGSARAALAQLLAEEAPQAADEELKAAAASPQASVDLSVLVPLSELYKREGNTEAYVDTTRKIIALSPTLLQKEVELGDGLVALAKESQKRGNTSEWKAKLREAANAYNRAVTANPNNAEWKYKLASVYADLNMLKAIRLFEEAAELDPKNPKIFYRWGVFLLNFGIGPAGAARLYDPEDGMKHLLHAIELDPKLGGAHYALGVAYKRQGEQDKAVAAFERAASFDFSATEGDLYLAEYYANAGQGEKAVPLLERAMAAMPNDVEVMKDFGFTALKYGSPAKRDEAIAALQKAVQLAPEDPEALMNYGFALHDTKRSKEAIPYLEKAVSLDATSELAYYNLALALDAAGQKDRAIETWRHLLDMNPQGTYAQTAQERITYLDK